MIYDILQKKLYKILTNNGMTVHFMNGLNDIKSAWNWKVFTLKKNPGFPFSTLKIKKKLENNHVYSTIMTSPSKVAYTVDCW